MHMDERIYLCRSDELVDRGLAVPFDVNYGGQTCRGFAVRVGLRVRAYLNRCAHVAMEMDFQPNRFWDETGQWLICATHGAVYDPLSGQCKGGPCKGGLIPIQTSETEGQVHWHTAYNLKPLDF